MKPDPPEPGGHENPAFYQGLGRAIKVARAQLDLERKDLAERTGLSYAYLSDIETGRGRPSSSALLAIAKALGMEASSLLSEAEGYMKPQPEVKSRYFRSDYLRARLPASATRPNEPGPAMALSSDVDLVGRSRSEQIDQIQAHLDRLSPADLAMVLELVRRLAEHQSGQTT